MPIPEPKIDDRTFEQILAELRARIPRYTKEWTNFNDSDPGMTLVQLFAWLADQMLFRMNQVPRKNYVKFLQLLGEGLRGPRPARAHLTFKTKGDALAMPVPARTPVSASATDGGDALVFETERGLDLITPPLDVVGLFNGAGFTNVTPANDKPGTKFKPFGSWPDAGNALYLGFKPPDTPIAGNPPLFPQTMNFRIFLPAEATAGEPRQCDGNATPPVPPVMLVWEFRPKDGEPWQRLNVFDDGSAAFTREGYVRIEGPRAIEPSKEDALSEEPRFWIRVRLEGDRNYPPDHAPEIDFIRANTVEAVNLSTIRGEVLGVSEGHPNEQFETRKKPIASIVLQISGPTGEIEPSWKEVDDFHASKPEDYHFRILRDDGVVQFGDGDRGRIPVAGSEVLAIEYRVGGGLRGNGALAGTITSLQASAVGVDSVTNERAAIGGADEETLDEILINGPSLLRVRGRAVAPDDFKALVEEMGGVAHAVAIPLFHPAYPGVKVPGAVTVVVVPDRGDRPPKPSSDLLAEICAMLDGVRLLTTEVYVKGPAYQEVRVEARVSANPYASFDAVARDVRAAIDTVLDPKRGEFGKELFPTRFYSAILEVHDVVGVVNLNVYVDGRLHSVLEPVRTPPDGLLYGGDHFVTVEPEKDL